MVSVIIPVYNAEEYIEKCVCSVLKQTYSDLEIVLVNDGSRDKSLELLQELKNRDSRIVVIDQINQGVSAARNTGIEAASGKYVVFVDSDDIIPEGHIEDLHAVFDDEKCDLTICGYTDIYRDRRVEHVMDGETVQKLTGNLNEDLCLIRHYINPPWNKMYRRSIFTEKGIRFDDKLVVSVDMQFNFQYFEHVRSYAFVNKASYQYYRERSFLSKKRTLACYKSDKACAEYVYDYLNRHKVPGREYIMADKLIYIAFRYLLLSDAPNDYISARRRLTDIQSEWKPVRFPSKAYSALYALLGKGIVFPFYIALKMARRKK